MGSRQLIVFTIHSDEFGIDIGRISSIEKMLPVFKIPNTPDYVEGLINLRSKVHTVFNLRKRFGLPEMAFDDNTKIIMVNMSESAVGIIVDEVKEITKVDDSEFEDTPKALSTLQNQFLAGTVKIGARVIMLLNIDKILTAEANKQVV